MTKRNTQLTFSHIVTVPGSMEKKGLRAIVQATVASGLSVQEMLDNPAVYSRLGEYASQTIKLDSEDVMKKVLRYAGYTGGIIGDGGTKNNSLRRSMCLIDGFNGGEFSFIQEKGYATSAATLYDEDGTINLATLKGAVFFPQTGVGYAATPEDAFLFKVKQAKDNSFRIDGVKKPKSFRQNRTGMKNVSVYYPHDVGYCEADSFPEWSEKLDSYIIKKCGADARFNYPNSPAHGLDYMVAEDSAALLLSEETTLPEFIATVPIVLALGGEVSNNYGMMVDQKGFLSQFVPDTKNPKHFNVLSGLTQLKNRGVLSTQGIGLIIMAQNPEIGIATRNAVKGNTNY